MLALIIAYAVGEADMLINMFSDKSYDDLERIMIVENRAIFSCPVRAGGGGYEIMEAFSQRGVGGAYFCK